MRCCQFGSTGPRERRGGEDLRVQTARASRGREATGRIRPRSRVAASWGAEPGLEPGGRQRPYWREPVRPGARCDGDRGAKETDEGLREKGAWWMPWRWRPRKDAATRRNALGRRWQPEIRGSPNGATRPAHGRALWERSRRGHRGN